MFTLIVFKKYAVKKTEKVFKENANSNLKREVVFYAKTIKREIRSRKSIVFMFGNIFDKNIDNFLNCTSPEEITKIYGEINESLDIRDIAVLDSNLGIKCKFPKNLDISSAVNSIKHLSKVSPQKIAFIDFHINNDKSVSYSFVYLTKDRLNKPAYILFDFNPYDMYALFKTAQLRPYSQKYLWVINKQGILIYDPPAKAHPLITLPDNVDLTKENNGEALSVIVKNYILKGKTGVSRYIFRNVDKFVGYTYIKELGWGLGLTLPTETFYAPITNLSRDIDEKTIHTLSFLSIFSAFIILLSASVSMAVAKKVTKPILETIDAINAIISGDMSKRLPTAGNDELDHLAESVNKLMDFFDKIWTNIEKNRR
jgi:HAMP domain-containing protein